MNRVDDIYTDLELLIAEHRAYQKVIDENIRLKNVIDNIKAEIREETECHYGDKCLGANCPSNTDCMIMGEHAIEIIDRHIGERSE